MTETNIALAQYGIFAGDHDQFWIPNTFHAATNATGSGINGSGLPSSSPGLEPDRVVWSGLLPPKTGVPTGFADWFEPDRSSMLWFLQLWLQLSIWILIVSLHDLYVKCAD